MLNLIKRVIKEEDGQGMTEYILIVVLIAVAGILAWKAFGNKIIELVTGATEKLGEVSPK